MQPVPSQPPDLGSRFPALSLVPLHSESSCGSFPGEKSTSLPTKCWIGKTSKLREQQHLPLPESRSPRESLDQDGLLKATTPLRPETEQQIHRW